MTLLFCGLPRIYELYDDDQKVHGFGNGVFLSTFGYYMSPETGVQDLSRKPPLDLIPNVVVAVCRPKVLDHEELAQAEATSKNLVKLKQG